MIRTRFAPSPTGYLHVGGLRTALYSYLLAKKHGGQFILRIEDTDRERYVADGTLNILKSLYWAGIIPDEGVGLDAASVPGESMIVQTGTAGPYIQSERLPVYKEYIKKLLVSGHAYYCFCSPERLEELRATQQKNKLPTCYDRLCLNIHADTAAERVKRGERHVIRMKMSKTGATTFTDLIRGEITFENRLIDDQVLIKSDGFPTYHFAVVVDDHLMGITHVIRAEEWISSTPKHISLYQAFEWDVPYFAHLPLLLNADKSKLSKRQGDVAALDYRDKGYLPEAMINFIAFLGWNPGGERELFSLEELVKEFSLEKVSKAGAVFNLEKLDWYNREYLKRLNGREIATKALPWLRAAGILSTEETLSTDRIEWLGEVLNLEKERVTTLSQLPEAVRFIFISPEYKTENLIWKKSTKEDAQKTLLEIKELLNNFSVQSWQKSELETSIKQWIASRDYSNGSVLWPLRVALSGQENSPGPFEIASVLGKEETLRRVEYAIQKLVELK